MFLSSKYEPATTVILRYVWNCCLSYLFTPRVRTHRSSSLTYSRHVCIFVISSVLTMLSEKVQSGADTCCKVRLVGTFLASNYQCAFLNDVDCINQVNCSGRSAMCQCDFIGLQAGQDHVRSTEGPSLARLGTALGRCVPF